MSNPHALIIRNDYPALKKYLTEGGDPNAQESEWPNNTLLMGAVMQGDIKMISLILNHINKKDLDPKNIEDLNPNLKCGDGKTPLEIIQYKLEKGDKSAKKMSTLLDEAIQLYELKLKSIPAKKLRAFKYAYEVRGFPDLDEEVQKKISVHVRNLEEKKKTRKRNRSGNKSKKRKRRIRNKSKKKGKKQTKRKTR